MLESLATELGSWSFRVKSAPSWRQSFTGWAQYGSLTLTISASPELSAIPFEVACLSDHTVPARHPGVRLNRLVTTAAAAMPPPSCGPLKILVAVGTPDEGQTPNVALDREAEIGAILDAVGATVGDGRAEVVVLEVANTATISKALHDALPSGGFHVLHLSGHGSPTAIELETEDGAAEETSAADLVEAMQAAGAQVPLVFLSACHGATADEGLARELVRAGVPRVIAMQTAIGDGYATALAAAFYDRLAGPRQGATVSGTSPTVSDALAHARSRGWGCASHEQRRSC